MLSVIYTQYAYELYFKNVNNISESIYYLRSEKMSNLSNGDSFCRESI